MCPKSSESALGKRSYLLCYLERPQDTHRHYTGTGGSHTTCKCTKLYGDYNDVHVLSTDRRVKCELREAFSEMSYALSTPHPDYPEEGG